MRLHTQDDDVTAGDDVTGSPGRILGENQSVQSTQAKPQAEETCSRQQAE